MTDSTKLDELVFEGYPAAVAFDQCGEDGVALYLIDLPGCATQGTDIVEAIHKMQQLVPWFLDGLKARGVDAPPPSAHPPMVIAAVQWEGTKPNAVGVVIESPQPKAAEVVQQLSEVPVPV